MIKKVLKYQDFDGNEVVEEVYFHMSKMELIDMEYSHEGGLSQLLPELVKEGNPAKIIEMFKSILMKSYGKRSEDGRRFEKDPEATQEFMTSPAFDALFTELVSDPGKAAEFIQGIVPRDMLAELETAAAKNTGPTAGLAVTTGSGGIAQSHAGPVAQDPPWADREPTQKELMSMTKAQLIDAMRRRGNLPTE